MRGVYRCALRTWAPRLPGQAVDPRKRQADLGGVRPIVGCVLNALPPLTRSGLLTRFPILQDFTCTIGTLPVASCPRFFDDPPTGPPLALRPRAFVVLGYSC